MYTRCYTCIIVIIVRIIVIFVIIIIHNYYYYYYYQIEICMKMEAHAYTLGSMYTIWLSTFHVKI